MYISNGKMKGIRTCDEDTLHFVIVLLLRDEFYTLLLTFTMTLNKNELKTTRLSKKKSKESQERHSIFFFMVSISTVWWSAERMGVW